MDHFCIDYYTSDTSIRISSSGVYKLIFYLTIVKKHDVTVTLGWQDNSIFLSFVLDAQRNWLIWTCVFEYPQQVMFDC